MEQQGGTGPRPPVRPRQSIFETEIEVFTRPRRATVATWILSLFGLFGLLATGAAMARIGSDGTSRDDVSMIVYALFCAQIIVSGLQLVAAYGIWQGVNWGRVLAVCLGWANMASALLILANGAVIQGIIVICVYVAIINTLTQWDLKRWCR